MKQISTLLFFCLLNCCLFAQTITVGGTVTDADGNLVANQEIYIFSDSSFNTTCHFDAFVNTDANGQYMATFQLDGNCSQGEVFVNTGACGAWYTESDFWYPGNMNLTFDFEICANNGGGDTLCYVGIENTPVGALFAIASGTPPFVYEWSTGETTESIFPNTFGEFCVNVTDANACTATACYNTDPNGGGGDTLCYVWIDVQPGNATFFLTANAEGTAPFTYLWNTGENTSEIGVQSDGEYCVTVTDATGCEISDCAYISIFGGCSVFVEYTGSGSLTAQAEGTAPFTYLWDNGETTQSIFPNAIGEYCVMITDANGCTSTACGFYQGGGDIDSCSVYITQINNGVELIANAGGGNDFTYMWSTGETTPTINVVENGVYCITITSSDACEATDCITIDNLDDCSVFVGYVNDGISAFASGIAPFTYIWNTNETTQTVIPTNSGLYCVTTTDALGCTNSACISTDSCSAYISQSWADITLTATPSGVAPFTYDWSSGESTSIITFDEGNGGEYCVTITDNFGCVSTACVTVQGNNDYQIAGLIYPDSIIDNTINEGPYSGMVWLIVNDAIAGTLTAIDSLTFFGTPNNPNILYDFGDRPAGTYLVKAALNPNSEGYAHNLPTYHNSWLFWHEANEITVPYSGNMSFDIQFIGGENTEGPGFIGGLVSEGANFTSNSEQGITGEGDPVPNVSVLIFNENEEPLTHDLTDQDGLFGFADLPWGTYKIVVEILGKEQGTKWVTIGSDNPQNNGIEFNVTESSIETNANEVEIAGASLNFFPNPATANLSVLLPENVTGEAQINITNLTGQSVYSAQNNVTNNTAIQLNINGLATGVYFTTIQIDNRIYTGKFVKQ